MKFYIGTHLPHWLREVEVPLFVSRRRLEGYKHLPEAVSGWALDSGGFTELSGYGSWQLPPRAYVQLVRRFMVRELSPLCTPVAHQATLRGG